MLELGIGNEFEHAILLCNYLLFRNVRAWVLLGTGIPDGRTAYVLVKEDEDFLKVLRKPSREELPQTDAEAEGEGKTKPKAKKQKAKKKRERRLFSLYHASSGENYSFPFGFCPLKHIDCAFDNTNVSLHILRSLLLFLIIYCRYGLIFKHSNNQRVWNMILAMLKTGRPFLALRLKPLTFTQYRYVHICTQK
jgi:hypothetical protein